MTNDHSHLTAAAADLLSAPGDKRVRAIKSRRWILYPRAKQALDHLNRLIHHPPGGRGCPRSSFMATAAWARP